MLSLAPPQLPFGPTATQPELHIWQVEKLWPVEVPKASWGVFFLGDAYLVLHNGPDEGAHLSLWMGQDSSQDEQGACTLLSTQLNALLGEHPMTHHEVQGNESDVFMEYFPHGITYQEGGVDSVFKPTPPMAGHMHKLYQVKGKKNIQASERNLAWASFNTGDCFILDVGEVLGPKATLQEGSPEEDVVADQRNMMAAVLYKVSDMTGHMDLSQVATSSLFNQSLLCSNDCFVLGNAAGGKVYVWKGHKANEQECQAALEVAKEVIARMGLSPRTQVEILPQGHKMPLFKQFFTSWK